MTISRDEVMILNFLVEDKKPGAASLEQFVGRALRALRLHLGLASAYVSRIAEGCRVIRHVDCADAVTAVRPGQLEILDIDAPLHGANVPVNASRVSVPLCIEHGEVYGMLTCLIGAEHAPLNQNDSRTIRLFAEMIAEHIEADVKALTKKDELIARLESVISGEGVAFLYQPIFDIDHAEIVGFEALARFPDHPLRGPEKWFSDAGEVAMDAALETAILSKAFDAFARLPSSVSIGFNVSPKMVLSRQLDHIFKGMPLERVVLDVNEHLSFRQYDALSGVLAPMRRKGLRISVDDGGGGLDTFRHIVSLRPDIIKLNRSLVRQIDTEAAHRALVAGLVQFAKDQRCDVVAVGVENSAQLSKLKALGVVKMQGYLLGRPLPLAAAAALCDARTGSIPAPQAA